MDINELKNNILFLLEKNDELTFDEIKKMLNWSGDSRPLRKALSELVRESKVQRVPNYERRRMVFKKGNNNA
ncbi:hypothetical protein Calag_0700 [Caldisphaera lagunensis DSM 15908]|uniref:Uncharacterized protein n=1 Tax=Caldisphaera lagunensis (strain DSM 15908 / JCM 11604 / ANMR 0165 / IC-154) TaxID=1056495 RepID=L0ABM1_CALLD|nr:hypothetical protein [Caldisphaera lagunensis]AFZ70445.1 hypothetical protein Calag_0700 [Caldisphaera lagunensis DSM 15908]